MSQVSVTDVLVENKSQEKLLADYKASDYSIISLDLEFDLFVEKTFVKATSQVQALSDSHQTLFLFGQSLKLVSVRINGQIYTDYKEVTEGLELYHVPHSFELEIKTEIYPLANKTCEGLYISGDVFCTQCEAEGFRRITYYLDRPDILAKFTTKLIADKNVYPSLLSNGNCVEQGLLENGRHFVCWQDPFPKPAYLFALVAGDFDCLKDTFKTKSGRDVKLALFVDKGNLDKTMQAMRSLKKAMQWDEERFNFEYDLDVYMIVAVDFFNMGAMENKGLNIFNSKYVLASAESATDQDYLGIEAVIGHEYFHNWTGNRITCRDWFQLSLKEGLTVFRDQEFSSDLGSRSVNRIGNVKMIRNHQFAEDAGPMSHPIRPTSVMEMNNFYTVTVYNKGAEVIRMLHTLLGEEKFQQGMQLYVQRHDGQAVTCDDFLAAMSDASDMDLTLFKRWYNQSGTPVVNASDYFDARKNCYQITFKQKTWPTADQKQKQTLHIPIDIELLNSQGIPFDLGNAQTHKVISLTQKEQTFIFTNINEKPVPSLFRGFSAPVKYEYAYSDQNFLHLMRFSTDDFSRWDAGQLFFNKYLIENVHALQENKEMHLPVLFIKAFKIVLVDLELDAALIASMFEFISEVGALELFKTVDIALLHQARNFMLKSLAGGLQKEFVQAYDRSQLTGEYNIQTCDIAKRHLASIALYYIALADPILANDLVLKQIDNANNMTDHLSALVAANSGKLACRAAVMTDFDDKWFNNGLVMDKWFTLQASLQDATVLEKVKSLLKHRSFDMNNPNRLRSLIGGFAQGNPYYFHAADGSGYRFLTDLLIELNTKNPQVAARLITPLIQFQRLDEKRKKLIKVQLYRLLDVEGLALDLFEKVSKALQQ